MNYFHLDIDRWVSKFPLTDGADMWYGAGDDTVRGAAYFEQLKNRLSQTYDLGPTVPVDKFIMAFGEPERRDVTKVGGLPYRAADQKWPEFQGRPMTFVAQFRFTESLDHIGELAGDVLLVFSRDEVIAPGDFPGSVAFEWQPLGLTDLVSSKDVPPPAWKFVTAYGVRHRSVCYPDRRAIDVFRRLALPDLQAAYQEKYGRMFPDGGNCEGESESVAKRFCYCDGIKIGGLCYWTEPDNPETKLPGRYLCSLAGVGPGSGEYPWLNQAEPIDESQFFDKKDEWTLILWDGFIMNFSIDDHGVIHWAIQAA